VETTDSGERASTARATGPGKTPWVPSRRSSPTVIVVQVSTAHLVRTRSESRPSPALRGGRSPQPVHTGRGL